ncbi:MAG: SIS domain-containing protein [Caldicoprobacterales bacterium]|jgi:fructoselysine-6-P-deglycase FrlB-like protein
MDIEKLHRDIWSQPQVFLNHKDTVSSIPEKICEVSKGNEILLTGIATSLYALEGMTYLLASQKINKVFLINTCDLLDYWYPQAEDERPLFVLSRSGESAEIIRLVNTVKSDRLIIAVTENEDSMLARRSDMLLPFHAGEEAFPNTSSFTLSQLLSLGICYGLGYRTSADLTQILMNLVKYAEDTLSISNGVEEIGKLIAESKGIVIEGQGHLSGIVNQYALDFHETRMLGIPVTGGIMRHGVIELTEREGVMTLLLVPEDDITLRKFKIAEELHSAGKKVAVVTDSARSINTNIPCMRIPYPGKELEGIIFTMGMQLIYEQYVINKGLSSLTPKLVGKVTAEE